MAAGRRLLESVGATRHGAHGNSTAAESANASPTMCPTWPSPVCECDRQCPSYGCPAGARSQPPCRTPASRPVSTAGRNSAVPPTSSARPSQPAQHRPRTDQHDSYRDQLDDVGTGKRQRSDPRRHCPLRLGSADLDRAQLRGCHSGVGRRSGCLSRRRRRNSQGDDHQKSTPPQATTVRKHLTHRDPRKPPFTRKF